jgi:hypothetical protein
MVSAMTSDTSPQGNLLPPRPSCDGSAAALLLVQGPEVHLELIRLQRDWRHAVVDAVNCQ